MRFPISQKHRLYAEIAKLLRAGFSIDAAAETILSQRLPAVQRRYLEGLRRGLSEENLTIAEAVRATPVDLSPLETGIVEAGEQGGRLEEAFEHLSRYFEMLERARNRIRANLVYPVILLHAGVILPALPRAILAGDPSLALNTILLSLGFVYLLAAALFLAGSRLSRIARRSGAADALLRAVPIAGKARRALALGRFCNVFHIHLLASFSISRSLRAAGDASQSGLVRAAAARMAAGIESGSSLTAALAEERNAFPRDLAGSLSTAEAAGTLDVDLARWARAYHETAVDALDAASGWFPRAVYVLVALFVAWQILAMGMGYLNTLGGYLDD